MALSIQQETKYQGKHRWHWSVWLDGSPKELDDVEYVLHPTFFNPVRRVEERQTNFRLDAYSWDAFTVYAMVTHRDGHESSLQHDLELLYPDGTPTLA